MKKGQIQTLIIEYMIAFSFVMTIFGNVTSFYLTGNQNDTVRMVISWGLIFAVVLSLIFYVLRTFITADRDGRRNIFISLLPAALNAIALIVVLVSTKGDSYVFKICLTFFSYCVPLVCGGIYLVREKRLKELISRFRYVTLYLMPFYLLSIRYFWQLTPESNLGAGFYGMNYLVLGYSAVPLYAFLLCDLVMYSQSTQKKRVHLILDLSEIVLCSLVIVMSGTRGAFLAWIGTSILTAIVFIWKKERKGIWGIGLALLAVVVFFVVAPYDNVAVGRQLSFINEVKRGDLKNSLVSEEGKQLLNDMYEKSEGEQGAIDVAKDLRGELTADKQPVTEPSTGTEGTEPKEETDSSKEEEKVTSEGYKDAVLSVTNGSMARSYLFQLAIKEGINEPLTGMGLLGYQQKYKTYPHNILLEGLSDFGFIGLGVVLVSCAMVVLYIMKRAFKDWHFAFLLIVLSGQMVQVMLSGNLYSSPFVLFAFTTVLMHFSEQKVRESKTGSSV